MNLAHQSHVNDREGADAPLLRLRELLLQPVNETQAAQQELLNDVVTRQEDICRRTADVSEVLREAIDHLHEQGLSLADVLEPDILKGVKRTFDTEPDVMASALYPVLGPAVRKLVASLFETPGAGRAAPYAIEQLLLIHTQSSIVLSQVVAEDRQTQDADVVSGMLDAIRQFVQEAFEVNNFDGMNTLSIGDITVWVEWGPKAILAVVIRGMAAELDREPFVELLERIHAEHGALLDQFDGDSTTCDPVSAALESCLSDQTRLPGKPPWWRSRRLISCIIATATLCLSVAWVSQERQARWDTIIHELSSTPGLVVVSSKQGWSESSIRMLKDPLARSPKLVLLMADIDPSDLQLETHAFVSADEQIIQRRTGRSGVMRNTGNETGSLLPVDRKDE